MGHERRAGKVIGYWESDPFPGWQPHLVVTLYDPLVELPDGRP
jgi:hypothetical protein